MRVFRSLSVLAIAVLPAAAMPTEFQPELPAKAVYADPLLEQLRFQIADKKRMKATVKIGDGPDLAFIVDTGAERSAIATETATALALPASGSLRVVSFDGSGTVPTVRISGFQFGKSRSRNLDALTFSRSSLGADGLLGVDSLKGKVVTFDFDDSEMRIEQGSSLRAQGDGAILVEAAQKDGRLVFSTARVNRIPTAMILDTGSDLTIGNDALRRVLQGRGQLDYIRTVRLLTTTGQVMRLDYTIIESAQFGPVRVRNLPIAFSTTEPFEELGLSKKPAILLGMDALRAFGEVSVDFRRHQVRFSPKRMPRQVAMKE